MAAVGAIDRTVFKNVQEQPNKNNMKSMMTLVAVFAAALMMTTGCKTCCKSESAKPAMACDGSCCTDHATCTKCCKDAAGCAKCCHKS